MKRIFLHVGGIRFSAAHYLPGQGGKCENMHGHEWEVEAVFEGRQSSLNSWGAIADFSYLKKIVREAVEVFDHKVINDVLPESCNPSPTCETITDVLFRDISVRVKRDISLVVWLHAINVKETPGCSVTIVSE